MIVGYRERPGDAGPVRVTLTAGAGDRVEVVDATPPPPRSRAGRAARRGSPRRATPGDVHRASGPAAPGRVTVRSRSVIREVRESQGETGHRCGGRAPDLAAAPSSSPTTARDRRSCCMPSRPRRAGALGRQIGRVSRTGRVETAGTRRPVTRVGRIRGRHLPSCRGSGRARTADSQTRGPLVSCVRLPNLVRRPSLTSVTGRRAADDLVVRRVDGHELSAGVDTALDRARPGQDRRRDLQLGRPAVERDPWRRTGRAPGARPGRHRPR